MINGLGVLGWGVGGIEAEAAMLGQAMSMLMPQVLGFKLSGELPEGATATDLVLTVTQMLRERGVVGMFVEFFGPGVAALPLADRATIGNMSPEFGSTCAIFPIDAETLRYLEFSGRPEERVALVEAYAKEQGLWHDEDSEEPTYSDTLELDLSDVVPSLAGPKRPQDRVSLTESKAAFRLALEDLLPDDVEDPGKPDPDEESADSFPSSDPPSSGEPANHDGARDRSPSPSDGGTGGLQVAERVEASVPVTLEDGTETELDHGHVVIAAITSCTNTSNPDGHARRRHARAQRRGQGPEVQAVGEDVAGAGLEGRHRVPRARRADRDLEALGFHLVGYGCTTCIGNSGPAAGGDLRRRQRGGPRGRLGALGQPQLRGPHQPRREDELPRVAAAGRRLRDRGDDGHRPARRAARPGPGRQRRLPQGHLAREQEVAETVESAVQSDMFRKSYGEVFDGDERWNSLDVPEGDRFEWAEDSTYVRLPPYFEDFPTEPPELTDVEGARVLAVLGDSVTTDHISPAGAIKESSPAGEYLKEHGVERKRLQLLRRAPRQPRGDGARHVREHPPAQPARARDRGRRDAPPAGRRGDDDLRRGHEVRRGGHAARRPRGQGVRLGLVARLGREGHERCSACAP